MKKVLVLSNAPYGYQIDAYNWCKYLKEDYEIAYLGPTDIAIPEENDIRVNHYNIRKNKIINKLNGLYLIIREILKFKPDIIICSYFKGCGILKKLFWKKKFILDIRTASVNKDINLRKIENKYIKKESDNFENITIITESIAKILGINKFSELPLGANCQIEENLILRDRKLNLLYVGTLTNRKIIDTVKGVHLFLMEHNYSINIKYNIIGYSTGNELEEIKQYIKNNNLEQFIFTLGYVKNTELKSFFNNSNIGISYIPITEYFNYQPPTKTFEYLANGMVVIATNTVENSKIINEENGIIINDTSEDFRDALNLFIKHEFNYKKILKKGKKYSWEYIVKNDLVKIIEKVLNN